MPMHVSISALHKAEAAFDSSFAALTAPISRKKKLSITRYNQYLISIVFTLKRACKGQTRWWKRIPLQHHPNLHE